MSGQWEVVAKKKSKTEKNPQKVPLSNGNRKQPENIKLEEVLSKSNYKNLYSNKTTEQTNELKKPEKKAPVKKPAEKVHDINPTKPKAPKSIESALNTIDVGEFRAIFEKSRAQFADAPIIWLKELAQFLNLRLPIEINDPTFSNKALDYPLRALPADLRAVIEQAVTEARPSNAQLFFEIALASMATEMGKGFPAFGHRLFLQHIARHCPALVVANLQKHVALRNSYQNRPNVGLSVLWTVGQVGFGDLQLGLTVFEELMLPLAEMKNYSKFCYQYLVHVIASNASKQAFVTKEQYFLVLDTVYGNKKNFPSNLKDELEASIVQLKPLLFNCFKNEGISSVLEYFLKKLPLYSNKSYRLCICNVIIGLMNLQQVSLDSWQKIYERNEESAFIFLQYLENNFPTCSKQMSVLSLNLILNGVEAANNDEFNSKSRKNSKRDESEVLVQKVRTKMAKKDNNSRSSRWYLWLLLITLSLLVYLDVKKQGSWKESQLRKSLVNSGVADYIDKGMDYAKLGVKWSDDQLEQTFPGYRKTINEYSAPYITLAQKMGKIVYNVGQNFKEIVMEKYPNVIKSIESYAPGLVEQSQNAVSNAWSTSVLYIHRSIDYLKTEVFVGQLSPENMQRVVIEALNTTQIKATEYYHWLYEKVQTTIK